MFLLMAYLAWQVFFGCIFLLWMFTMPQYQNVRKWGRHEFRFWLTCSFFWPITLPILVFDMWQEKEYLGHKFIKWSSSSKS